MIKFIHRGYQRSIDSFVRVLQQNVDAVPVVHHITSRVNTRGSNGTSNVNFGWDHRPA